jgi:aminoglycoside phosphotransferase (APT) family kinase protein
VQLAPRLPTCARSSCREGLGEFRTTHGGRVSDRSSDVRLDAAAVAALVAGQFPDLAGQPVRRLGDGWDHDLYTVGADWIFRFPKRASRVPWLAREIQVNAIVADALGPRTPRFEHIGIESASFPYPFVGYRKLRGVGADEAAGRDPAGLAADIAGLLSRLHRIEPGLIPPTPASWERESWAALRAELAGQADLIRPLLGTGLRARAEPYLAGRVPEPARDGPRRFIHNDICADHLIVDNGSGRLVGLIDLTDCMVGEVVLDFVGLIAGVGGYDFIGEVAAGYDLPLGASFDATLEWLARTLTLTWLAEAAREDPGAIPKHLSWVARAFSR